MRKLHVTNSAGRDSTVTAKAPRPPQSHTLAREDGPVNFRRFIAAAEDGLDEHLVERLGEAYGASLRDGDPEINFEVIGREVGPTD